MTVTWTWPKNLVTHGPITWSPIFYFFVADDEKKDEVVFGFEELDFINFIHILTNILIFHSSFQKRLIIIDNIKYRLALLIYNSFSDKKIALYYVESKITQAFSTSKDSNEDVLIEFHLFWFKISVTLK
jgi:hypothetical protein